MDTVHNLTMRVRFAATILFLAFIPAFANPPLRLALAAGPDGLRTAQDWYALAEEYRVKTGDSLEAILIATGADIVRALEAREAEAAVLDTAVFLRSRANLRVLGVTAENGACYERFLFLASAESVIYRLEDLSRARLVLASSRGALSWDLPVSWAMRCAGLNPGTNRPRSEAGYEGVLRSVALGQADAGFIPEGYFSTRVGSALADRVRIIAEIPAYPLAVFVVRRDLPPERAALAARLLGLSAGSLELRKPPSDFEDVLEKLAEALRVAKP